jgi:hypothetical protein
VAAQGGGESARGGCESERRSGRERCPRRRVRKRSARRAAGCADARSGAAERIAAACAAAQRRGNERRRSAQACARRCRSPSHASAPLSVPRAPKNNAPLARKRNGMQTRSALP